MWYLIVDLFWIPLKIEIAVFSWAYLIPVSFLWNVCSNIYLIQDNKGFRLSDRVLGFTFNSVIRVNFYVT